MPLGVRFANGHFGDVYEVKHEYILLRQQPSAAVIVATTTTNMFSDTPAVVVSNNNNNNEFVKIALVCKKMKQLDRLENFETEKAIALELSNYVTEHQYTIHVLLSTLHPSLDPDNKIHNLDAFYEYERHIFYQVINEEVEKSLDIMKKKNQQLLLEGKKSIDQYSDRDLLAYKQKLVDELIELDQHRLYIEEALGTLYHVFQPDRFQKLFGRPITDQDWFGVLWSVCHTLAKLGRVCEFRHNDMHIMNMFLVGLVEGQQWGKSRVTRRAEDGRLQVSMAYRVGDQQITLTHLDFIVKFGDFSLAETRSHKNAYVQKGKYEVYGIDGKYRPGYDWQVFLLSVFSTREKLQLSDSVQNWIKDALESMQFEWRSLIKEQQRQKLAFCLPNMNQVTTLTPADFISNRDLMMPIELMRTHGFRQILPKPKPNYQLNTNHDLLLTRSQDQQRQREYKYTHQKYNQNTRKYRSSRSIKTPTVT